jgi:hypothetical protein
MGVADCGLFLPRGRRVVEKFHHEWETDKEPVGHDCYDVEQDKQETPSPTLREQTERDRENQRNQV